MQWQQNAGWLNRKKEEAVTNEKVPMRWEFTVTLKSNQMKVNVGRIGHFDVFRARDTWDKIEVPEMFLVAIFVLIILAFIYHFFTEKQQILEWKETPVEPISMTAIPQKKTPEEIIKESKERHGKAAKKLVKKAKKKTKSKKSKKSAKSLMKKEDMSQEKCERKIESHMPETIAEVGKATNAVQQIVPCKATEELTKAAEKIRREDSEKKKRKLKQKSKAKKVKKMEKETAETQEMSTKKSETKLRTQISPFPLQNIAQLMEKQNIMERVAGQKAHEELTKVAEKIRKEDSKKKKLKTKKKSKATKSKKQKTEMTAENDMGSKIPEKSLEAEIAQYPPEILAQATESNSLIDRICGTKLSEVTKAAEKFRRKDSKKKDKKKSKSKKSKKSETETTVKQHMEKETYQTKKQAIESTPMTEITAIPIDERDIVEAIRIEKLQEEFIKEAEKTDKKESKKLKKKSKKRSKSKKSKKAEKKEAIKDEVTPQKQEDAITTQIPILPTEITAMVTDESNIAQPLVEKKVETVESKDEQKIEKKDSKKLKKKSKKRSKSKKSKKAAKEHAIEEEVTPQKQGDGIISQTPILPQEITAMVTDEGNIAEPLVEKKVETVESKDEQKIEKKDSKKLKKKSKKRSKSKKSKKAAKEHAIEEEVTPQKQGDGIISQTPILPQEITAMVTDEGNIAEPLVEKKVETVESKDEQMIEKKDSKKLKKKSKKRSKSKKSKKAEKDVVDNGKKSGSHQGGVN
ncbi:hypothetical protein T4C_5808 [Trichinella pseudospiralis]|uniref:Zonadhesin n=2 Tax=Trichinella TaxID=6333 RepID=A0A0V1JZE1_TRIPS|nr:hypothetical protein T4C_5808 [Trichinella pseudospiralis]